MKAFAQLTLIIFLLLGYLSFAQKTYAQQGCCSWHGGINYCDTATGRYVCNDGTYSPTCTCGGGYYYAPTPQPTCPFMSSYNSLTKQCECYSGYTASGNSCISVYTYCTNLYGLHSTYDYAYNRCKCSYGYRFNLSNTKCISNNESCQDQFGFNSKASIAGDKCECKYGYVLEGSICVFDTSDYDTNTYYYTTTQPTTPAPTVLATKAPAPSSTPTTKPSLAPSASPAQPAEVGTPAVESISTEATPTPEPQKSNNATGAVGSLLGAGALGAAGWGIYKYANRGKKTI